MIHTESRQPDRTDFEYPVRGPSRHIDQGVQTIVPLILPFSEYQVNFADTRRFG